MHEIIGYDKHRRRDEVALSVVNLLADDPDALDKITQAMTFGMRCAIELANARAAEKDRAMVAAFSMITTKRMTPGLREMIAGWILKGINPRNASPTEQEIMTRCAQPAE